MPAGIDIRHRKHCGTPRADGKCCAAAWQAYVFDKHSGKLIRRTFPNKTAARQWRQDAQTALRRGEFTTANGRTVTAPVVDRGPYVAGRQWDFTGGLCIALGHCYTGPILWRRA